MSGGFSDLFSRQAPEYASARPTYPAELFDFVAALAPARRLAWDCATGNGQAAVDLANWFDHVIATDASAGQIANATPHPRVDYRVARAEASGIDARSVDLTTVAQALHWLDPEGFAAEVRRITVPGGIVAAWSYGSFHVGNDVEALLREFEHALLGPYWDPRRRWVDEGYRTIPFPFNEIEAPAFTMQASWTLVQLGAYLSTWSAVMKFRDATGSDPVRPLLEQLGSHWGRPGSARVVTWPLGVRVGRIG